MTTKYATKLCFSSRVHWFNVGKTVNKRTKKVLLITNLRNKCPKLSNKHQHKKTQVLHLSIVQVLHLGRKKLII